MGQRGQLIIVGGSHGSGKDTHGPLLLDRLNAAGQTYRYIYEPKANAASTKAQQDVLAMPEPRDPLETALRYLLVHQIAITQIVTWLEAGQNLIINNGPERCYVLNVLSSQLPPKVKTGLAALYEHLMYTLLKPDLVLLLDVNAEEAKRRALSQASSDWIQDLGLDFYQSNRQHFLDLAKGQPLWTVINTDQPIQQTADLIWQTVKQKLNL